MSRLMGRVMAHILVPLVEILNTWQCLGVHCWPTYARALWFCISRAGMVPVTWPVCCGSAWSIQEGPVLLSVTSKRSSCHIPCPHPLVLSLLSGQSP